MKKYVLSLLLTGLLITTSQATGVPQLTHKSGQKAAQAATKSQPAPAEEEKNDENSNTSMMDPFEPLNRIFFAIHDVVDNLVLRPVSIVYETVMPEPVRDGVSNVLSNILTPVTFVNHVLQGRPDIALETIGRFTVNTTLGIGGFFDVAGQMDLKKKDVTFDDTLAVWGISPGPYLFIPVVGPSSFRDAVGRTTDYFSDPVNYYYTHKGRKQRAMPYVRSGVTALDTRHRLTQTIDDLRAGSSDYYATVRSIYHQKAEHRRKELSQKPN